MLVSVVPIGNSKGIRLPKVLLDQLQISDQVELAVDNRQIILTPVLKQPRKGWDVAFKEMSANQDDSLIFSEGVTTAGVVTLPADDSTKDFDWEW
jgi:antitoxin MazE